MLPRKLTDFSWGDQALPAEAKKYEECDTDFDLTIWIIN